MYLKLARTSKCSLSRNVEDISKYRGHTWRGYKHWLHVLDQKTLTRKKSAQVGLSRDSFISTGTFHQSVIAYLFYEDRSVHGTK